MPLTIIRKFSHFHEGKRHRATDERHQDSNNNPGELPKRRSFFSRLHLSNSDSSLHTVKERTGHGAAVLPSAALERVVDACDVREKQLLRGVSKTFKNYVDSENARMTRLTVEKRDTRGLKRADGWTACGAHVYARQSGNHVHIVVDSKWTANDIRTVVGAMSVYRKHIVEATIDAPIAELLVASLSVMNLDRWYAFQCYMKAMNLFDEDVHLTCGAAAASSSPNNQPYWPLLECLTVHTTSHQAPHLSRILDYGVAASNIIDRRVINELRIVVDDQPDEQRASKFSKDINHFRCWAGSAGFDDRFRVCVGAAGKQLE